METAVNTICGWFNRIRYFDTLAVCPSEPPDFKKHLGRPSELNVKPRR